MPIPMEMYLSIIRHLLTLAGGIMATKGYINGAMLDTVVSSVIAVGATTWGAIQKIEQARHLALASASTTAAERPAASAQPVSPPSSSLKVVVAFLALSIGYALAVAGGSALAHAEGIDWKGKQYTPPTSSDVYSLPKFSSPVVYMSLIGVYSRAGVEFEDEHEKFEQDEVLSFHEAQWRLGLGIGYLVRSEKWAAGADFDATRRVSGGTAFDNELDNWNFSARVRGGYFITPNVLPYLTVGYAHAWTQDTLVYGLGVETFLTERTSVRVEALKYEFDNSLLDLRVSFNFKF